MSDTPTNSFTHGALAGIYVRTAVPLILMMAVSGLLAVADALFLGIYVGPSALAAVTLMFPIYMLIVALSTLVSNGMSSQLARFLGAGNLEEARGVFTGAHGMALAMSMVLIVLFVSKGPSMALLIANGSQELADMGVIYLQITVFFSPLLFVLSVNIDALRNEGRVSFMASMSFLVSIANIGFNYVLIALLDMGVAGSAYGTAAAQALAFTIILLFRFFGKTALRPVHMLHYSLRGYWSRILALGAPQSLNFLGIALGSAAIIAALQWVAMPGYADTVTAYGIITRIITFAILPLLGLSFAMQTITGNNYGAELWHRSDASLRIAIWVGLLYCALVETVVLLFPGEIAAAFVDEAAVIAEVVRILPIMTSFFFLAGPLMMIGAYFQAIGFAAKAAILGLTKPYAFSIPLTFLMPIWFGEAGIWYAAPLAEILLLLLTFAVLWRAARETDMSWGMFHVQKRAG